MRQLIAAFAGTLFLSVLTSRGEPFLAASPFARNWGHSVLINELRCGSNDDAVPLPHGEVVGAAGRMGSLWLKAKNTVAVPRGVAPGCLSAPDTPIYVATPSQTWQDVLQQTLVERRDDLVWIGNGLPLDEFEHGTVVVPHYGILRVGEDPVTSQISPPTFVYGKHSGVVQSVLEQYGISTKTIGSWQQVRVAAARKLLWASCMWLLCHAGKEEPLTFSQVHKGDRQDVLEALVEELMPALQDLTGSQDELEKVMEYLKAYSLSMPDAIPSKTLAIGEVKERNGVWLGLQEKFPQPLHEELLRQVMGGNNKLSQALASNNVVDDQAVSSRCKMNVANLTIWGSRTQSTPPRHRQEVIVVGAGIVGSCTALNLARRGGVKVTVYDRLSAKENVGATTPASWAWINANDKFPIQYQWLNQLGMRSWKYDKLLKDFVTWNGALVSYASPPEFSGGYTVEGPLTRERLHELEPLASFSEEGQTYYFPQDGCVDPCLAVKTLHKAAAELGVEFKTEQEIVDLVRDSRGCLTGVVSKSIATNATSTASADVVVVAAGVGSSSPAFGGLPLLHRPGQIAFCKPTNATSNPRLGRILVDTVRKSHVLQRHDGAVVVGGGDLEVGGKSTAQLSMMAATDKSLLKGATALAGPVMQDSQLTHVAQAFRPIPQDGLPAIGYLESGLYVICTHSGVTLAPLLGALAAAEVVEGMSCDLLKMYRPTRFSRQS